jgi:predicted nucleotidyltransferase
MSDLASLAMEIGVSERTLRRAVNTGGLRAVRMSPRKIRLPISEMRFIRRSWRLVANVRGLLRTEKNIRLALLFGSVATGEEGYESDVDIAVSLRNSDLDRIVDLSVKLSTSIGRRVDLIRLEDAESDPSFLREIVGSGRVLVDRQGLWPRLQENVLGSHTTPQEQDRDLHFALAAIDRLLAS